MHHTHAHKTDSFIDSALLLGCEHIVTHNKNNSDIEYVDVAVKNIALTTEHNTYNSEKYIACLYRTTS